MPGDDEDGVAVDAETVPAIFRKFSQSVSNAALSATLNKMAAGILADGRVDEEEAAQLEQLLKGIEGQDEFRKALADARADGVITMEESASLERFILKLGKGGK